MQYNDIHVAYIGGGSRMWARTMMGDIALQNEFTGVVKLYDIDRDAAEQNKIVSERINAGSVKNKWRYEVCQNLQEALTGADFVLVSILPGTLEEMKSDVHTPEKYGIYQSVGDTAGPGGIVRAMRAIPMFEEIAKAIGEFCPDAFVINFTNPMTYCTQTLADVFKGMKVFGCCHEVFGTKWFLASAVEEMKGITGLTKDDIDIDVHGVNHFTWITRASYKGEDLFPLYREYIAKHSDKYVYVPEKEGTDYLKGVHDSAWETADRVKMDLFLRYGQIAAAGDRHLSEFLNQNWYLKDPKTVAKWSFGLTPVEWRMWDRERRIKETQDIVACKDPYEVEKSPEDFVTFMSALLGVIDPVISNLNLPNIGQADYAPMGAVVETNAIFTHGAVRPIAGGSLNKDVKLLVNKVVTEQQNVFRAIRERDLDSLFLSFCSDNLCVNLTVDEARALFNEMIENTKSYLSSWNLK